MTVRKDVGMHLTVNGQARDIPDNVTVSGMLDTLDVRSGAIAVEVNGEIVSRSKHGEAVLQEGDIVEIVTFVGGG